jgi:RND family efflux transporter MFP subunit
VLSGCQPSESAAENAASKSPRAAVVQVMRRNIETTLEIASEFQPYQDINVYAKVSGYIQQLNVNWGTRVKRGQLLAVLEVPELQQQLALDQASVNRSQQDVSRSKEELNRAQSAYDVAHLTYTRLAGVQKTRPELVAQQEIDIAHGKDTEADAGVSAAKAALAGAEQELAGTRAALDKDRAMFAYSRITAPFDGVVTELDAYTGSLLPAGTSSNKGDQALCKLAQNDLLRLVIPVPERAVPNLRLGASVAVNVSGLNRKFDGKIVRFSDQIDPATRTMHTEVDVPNSKYELIPGMYATVKLPLETAQNTLTVPLQAVQASGEGRGAVLVVGSDNRIERRDLTLGLESATEAQVLSGLRENERVIFGEQAQFKPGDRVTPTVITPTQAE